MIRNAKIEVIPGTLVNFLAFEITNIPETGGNAVISAINNNNEIVWSWHLWITREYLKPVSIWNSIPEGGPTGGTEYKIMPVNLGWTWDDNTKSHGKNVYYQWGRKDPIPGASAYNSTSDPVLPYGSFIYNGSSGTVPLSIKNPNKFYTQRGSNNVWNDLAYFFNYWNSECTVLGFDDVYTEKTVYDPCPVGWKVPPGGAFRGFTSTGGNSTNRNIIGGFDSGYIFKRYFTDTIGNFFPASGYRGRVSWGLISVGSFGILWTSAAFNDLSYMHSLYYTESSVVPLNGSYCASGISIRPILQ